MVVGQDVVSHLSDAGVLLSFVGYDGVSGKAGEQGMSIVGVGVCLVPKMRLERVKWSEWFPRR